MAKTGFNNLRIEIYEGISTILRRDTGGFLETAAIERMDTFFPSGLFGSLVLFVPMDVNLPFSWMGGDRAVIRNGQLIVWEGSIVNISFSLGEGAQQGLMIECAGFWQTLLGKRTLNKRWADSRVGANAWESVTADSGSEKARLDRKARLRITPKRESWTSGEIFSVKYESPTGQTIKRVKVDRDFQEAAQQWELRLRDRVGAANVWSLTANTTDTDDTTLGTPRQTLHLEFIARANQTGISDGTIYGEISNLEFYSETGVIQIDEIAKDIRALVSEINTDESNIDAPANPIELLPFVTNGQEAMTSTLENAASFGDADFAQWYVQLQESEIAASPDGKPVMVVREWPSLASPDYIVSAGDDNLQPPFEAVRDFDSIVNWVAISYRDIDNERNVTITPDDDASLKDDDSISDFGERHLPRALDIGLASNTTALNIGQRLLAANKDPKFFVSGPINVTGSIRTANNLEKAVSEIRAGEVIRVENFLDDLTGVGTGLTFVITATRYNDFGETNALSTGVPDDFGVFFAQLSAGLLSV